MDRLTARDGARITDYIPLQRMGETQDIANMAVFLFSDAANWVTGQIIVSPCPVTAFYVSLNLSSFTDC